MASQPNEPDSPSKNRRSLLAAAGAFALGSVVVPILGDDVKAAVKELGIGYLDKLGLRPGAPVGSVSKASCMLLFADAPRATGITYPGTNRLRLKQDAQSKPSRYVRTAFERSTGMQKGLLGIALDKILDPSSKQMRLTSQPNILVLGGPVATPYFRQLGGYEDFETKEDGTLIPLPCRDGVLPFYFHVGNRLGYGRWGSEKRTALRITETGEETVWPLYGIRLGPRTSAIAPPLDGKRLAGDMLMIMRVPNPHRKGGVVTMIGGLHGYSLEAFSSELEESATAVAHLTENYKDDFFQLLIPYRLDRAFRAKMDLKGRGDWQVYYKAVDGEKYRARLGYQT